MQSQQLLIYSKRSSPFMDITDNYRVQKSPPLAPELEGSSTNPPTILFEVTVIIIYFLSAPTSFKGGVFPTISPTKIMFSFVLSSMHVTCLVLLIILDLVLLITVCKNKNHNVSHYTTACILLQFPRF